MPHSDFGMGGIVARKQEAQATLVDNKATLEK